MITKYKLFENKNTPPIVFNFDDILRGYINSALWVNVLDGEYSINDFTNEEINVISIDINSFIEKSLKELTKITNLNINIIKYINDLDAGVIGHNLWLTRNGHGSGFWDSKIYDIEFQNIENASDTELYTLKNHNLGKILTNIANKMGETSLWFNKPLIDKKMNEYNI